MRRLLAIGLLLLTMLPAAAQQEQDFASTYMKRYAEGTALSCTTVSPAMMARLLNLEEVEADKETAQAISQLKSIRIVEDKVTAETESLYGKAKELFRANSKRYTRYDEYDGKTVYMRKRGKIIVELVLITKNDGHLSIIDLTGNMTEKFVKDLTQL